MDTCTVALRCRREASCVGKRIDRASAFVNKRSTIAVGAKERPSFAAIDQSDRGAPPGPLRSTRRLRCECSIVHRRIEPATVAAKSALDAVLVDEPIDEIGGGTRERDDALAAVDAELRDELVGVPLEARQDLATIAARCAEPGATAVERNDGHTRNGEMESSGESGVTSADHTNVGLVLAIQCCARGVGWRGGFPQRTDRCAQFVGLQGDSPGQPA